MNDDKLKCLSGKLHLLSLWLLLNLIFLYQNDIVITSCSKMRCACVLFWVSIVEKVFFSCLLSNGNYGIIIIIFVFRGRHRRRRGIAMETGGMLHGWYDGLAYGLYIHLLRYNCTAITMNIYDTSYSKTLERERSLSQSFELFSFGLVSLWYDI